MRHLLASRSDRFLTAVIVAILAVGGWAAYCHIAHPSAIFSYNSVALGSLWAQDELRHRVALTNLSNSAMEISAFRTSCGCTGVVPSNVSIPAGESAEVEIVVNLASVGFVGALQDDTAKAAKPAHFTIIPRLADGRSLEPYQLTVDLKAPFVASDLMVRFEKPLVRGQPGQAIPITLSLSEEITDVKALSDDPRIAVETHALGDNTCLLSATFTGESPPGLLNSAIALYPQTVDGQMLSVLTLPVRCHVLDDIVLEPTVLYVNVSKSDSRNIKTSEGIELTDSPSFTVSSQSGRALSNVTLTSLRKKICQL